MVVFFSFPCEFFLGCIYLEKAFSKEPMATSINLLKGGAIATHQTTGHGAIFGTSNPSEKYINASKSNVMCFVSLISFKEKNIYSIQKKYEAP